MMTNGLLMKTLLALIAVLQFSSRQAAAFLHNKAFLSTVLLERSILFNEPSAAGHGVPGNAPKIDLPEEEIAKLKQKAEEFRAHQEEAPKLSWAMEVRTLVQNNHGYAVMSTISKAEEGYPGGSVVGFVPDSKGNPMFLFSGMSSHTQDILVNPKCSVTIAAKEFKGAADGRVNLMGTAEKLPQEEIATARELYLQKHPNSAVWIDFGDFNWFRMKVEKIRFVGGFARAGSVSAEEYAEATPDPIAAFGGPIASHMNEDHSSATVAMVKGIPGLDTMNITGADIVSVDSLGMYIKVTQEPGVSFQPEQFKLRLPFPRKAEERKDVKTLIVELTQSAAQ